MTPLRRLIREVHRRSVWQVLGIYLFGAWIGYQVVLNVMQGFGLPDWVAPFSLVLFVIGLPIVVATAFVQEGPPERADFERGGPASRAQDPRDAIPGFSTAADDMYAPAPPLTATPAPAPAAPTGVSRHLTWRRAILAGIAAFLVLAVSTAGWMGLRSAGVGPMGSLLGKGEIAERDAIVLAQFTAPAGDGVLAASVTEAFRVDFEQSTVVRLVGPTQIADVLRRMQRDPLEPLTPQLAREIAEREGHKAVLAGEVNPVGRGFVLSARLLAADGRVLASARENAADSAEVLPAIDALSETLRERIGESLRSIRDSEPLEQVTTSSMTALRLYTQAQTARDEGDNLRSIALLQEAIAVDSGFAMAWRKIGAISSGPGMDAALRVQAATRAYELRDRLTERERHLAAAAYHDWVEGDADAAARAYRLALDADPDNTAALNNLALILSERGDHEEAERLTAHALALGGSAVFIGNHAAAAYRVGKVDAARATLERGTELYPSNFTIRLTRASLEAAEGNYDASDSILREARLLDGPDPSVTVGLYWQTTANAAVRGRLREASRAAREMERIAREYAQPDALLSALWRAHLVLALTDDATRALREADEALTRYPLEQMQPIQRPYAPLIALLLFVGEEDRARALVAQRDRDLPAAQRGAVREHDFYIGVAQAISAGELERAHALVEDNRRHTTCDACGLGEVAGAFARAGQTDRAIQLYEELLAYRDVTMTGDVHATSLHRALFVLGELYEQRGDLDAASRSYARFVELWEGADPELQPKVREARARLQAIVARRG